MQLIDDWGLIARKAHSMWAQYLAVIFLVAPELIYRFGVDTNPRVWWVLALIASIYGIVGRLLKQPRSIPDPVMRSPWPVGLLALVGVVAIIWQGQPVEVAKVPPTEVREAVVPPPEAFLAEREFLKLAVPFIGGWEGLRLEAYQDIVGVWTVCYGETKGVKQGDRHTKAECDAMFSREILSYRAGLDRYFNSDTRASRLPVERHVAFTSLAYNVGVAGVGKSTATRRLNAGHIAAACEALTWWDKAGGRVVRGLVRRRAAEFDLCMLGVS